MRRGEHAAEDGSFGRSAGVNMLRGSILIGVAVAIGLVLLQDLDDTTDVSTDIADSTAPSRTVVERTTTTLRPAQEVKVLVVNGTTAQGAAARINDMLKPQGFNLVGPSDGTAAAKAARRNSLVYYSLGYDREANVIARVLGLAANTVQTMPTAGLPVTDLKGAHILVLVGPDLAAQRGTAATSRPTTVAPGTSTSTTRRL